MSVMIYHANVGRTILYALLVGIPTALIAGPIYAVAHHPKDKVVASAGFDGIVYLNNPDTGALIRQFVAVPIAPAKKG